MYFPPPDSGSWTTGLCGCFEDCESCVCGWCCPCIPVGRYVNVLGQGSTDCVEGGVLYCLIQIIAPGHGWLYTCGYRGRLRQRFGLPASPCGDCLTEFCCEACSICQITRELNNRGINPKLGYENVKRAYENPPRQVMKK